MKFSKKLSQLESLYEVAKPVVSTENPVFISDFIHHAFENPADFKLEGISKRWFQNLSQRDMAQATTIVQNLLQENGHLISRTSIMEGIEAFKNDPE